MMEPTLQPTAHTEHDWYRALYKEHRNAFVRWAQQRYQVEDEEAHDAFQEAVIVLYRKSNDGRLAELNCSVRTAELVRQRLAELKPDDRRVLELYYLEGNNMDAVAEAMGLKNRNVAKKKKHYALQRLIALVRVGKTLIL